MSALHELVRFAEVKFPYCQQYKAGPERLLDLAQASLVDHSTFWEANSRLPPENRVLTSSSLVYDALIRTGGTTAISKASSVIREERIEGAKA